MNKGPINIEWFIGAETNICYNAVDRHVKEGRGDRVCFFWEGNDVGVSKKMTYKEVLDAVCQAANYLKSIGIGKVSAAAVGSLLLPLGDNG
jgi:acetyl-CoA synthetase